MYKPFRTTLGPHFSEGARQLWLRMAERGWEQPRLSAEVEAGPGTINKILYGDRRVGARLSVRFEEVLGIRPRAFLELPLKEFAPPHAVAAQQQPSEAA
jgi:hypothetical protein